MSVNSSSSVNTSLPPTNSFRDYVLYCFLNTTAGSAIMTAFTVASILILLPVYIFVLYVGLQQWKQQRTNMMTNHSDLFTYNMIAIELMSVFGCILTTSGVHTNHPEMINVGVYMFNINTSGQMFFHLLTCVERYLAAVHPITYMSLRKTKGIRIRNIAIGSGWVLTFTLTGFLPLIDTKTNEILTYVITAPLLIGLFLCNLSVLCIFSGSRVGEGGGRQRVDRSKLRVFYTILAILGVLLVRFGWDIFSVATANSLQMGLDEKCALFVSVVWIGVPSSLVLPLLFLQRAGKLACCKNKNDLEQASE